MSPQAFCSQCGSSVTTNGAPFCSSCGASLAQNTPAKASGSTTAAKAPMLEKVVGGIVATVIGGVIVAAIVIFAGYEWLCGTGQPFCR